jgi:hypothetical protein
MSFYQRKYIPVARIPQDGQPTIENIMQKMMEFNAPALCLVASHPEKEPWVVLVHRFDHAATVLLTQTLKRSSVVYEIEFPEGEPLSGLRKYMQAEGIHVAAGEGYISLLGIGLCERAAVILNNMGIPCNLPERN